MEEICNIVNYLLPPRIDNHWPRIVLVSCLLINISLHFFIEVIVFYYQEYFQNYDVFTISIEYILFNDNNAVQHFWNNLSMTLFSSFSSSECSLIFQAILFDTCFQRAVMHAIYLF